MIYIIETGSICDIINHSDENFEQWLNSPYPFNAGCTVIPDAYLHMDSRKRTKESTLLCSRIAKAKDESNIILLAPNAGHIDKRVRDIATVIGPARAGGSI